MSTPETRRPLTPADLVEQSVPYDLLAEENVLGALLIDRDAIGKVESLLAPDDFYREAHGWVYAVMLDLLHQRVPPDATLVASALARAGRLELVGGHAFLFHVVNTTATAVHAEYYAKNVRDAAVRRRLIQAGGAIAALGFDTALDLPAVEEQARGLLTRPFTTLHRAGGLQSLAAIADVSWETILPATPDAVQALPTGFPTLDRLIGGLFPAELIVVAARPGMGKTALALNIARHMARAGKRVGFFSLEMTKDSLFQRLIAAEAHVDLRQLRTSSLSPAEYQRALEALGVLTAQPLHIDDRSRTVAQAVAAAHQFAADAGVDCLFVDYLQLMDAGDKRYKDREPEVAAISRALSGLAHDLRVPVVALAQMNRGIEGRASGEPELSDLRESGAQEQDADMVWFLTPREVPPDQSIQLADKDLTPMTLWFKKNRNGPTGYLPMALHGPTTQYYEVAR